MVKKKVAKVLAFRYKVLALIFIILAGGLVLLPKYKKQEGIKPETLLSNVINPERYISTDNLAHKIEFKLNNFKEFIKFKPTRKVAYFIWNDPLMVAGQGTFINEMLAFNKFENVFLKNRYPETSIEELKSMEIELE